MCYCQPAYGNLVLMLCLSDFGVMELELVKCELFWDFVIVMVIIICCKKKTNITTSRCILCSLCYAEGRVIVKHEEI